MLIDASTYNYCENLSQFWVTQPINVLSNLIFWWAAYTFWINRDRLIVSQTKAKILAFLSFMVGLDSAIWHLVGTQWALMLDISSIGVFTIISMYWIFRDRIKWSRFRSFMVILAVIMAAITAKDSMPHIFTLNSGAFLPLTAALLIIGGYMKDKGVFVAGLCLGAGIAFRVLDLASCAYIPFGTHFLWHIFAGFALLLFTKTLYRKNASS